MAQLTFTKTILSWVFSKPSTRLYPFEKRPAYDRTRGHIGIDVNACIFCGICQRKCPATAIAVDKPNRTWTIDRYRCVQCNACVEVCPKKCLSMLTDYPAPSTKKSTETFQGPKPAETPAKA